jgi:hypothetical protein
VLTALCFCFTYLEHVTQVCGSVCVCVCVYVCVYVCVTQVCGSDHSAALLHPIVRSPRPPHHKDVPNAFVAGGSCGAGGEEQEEGREGERLGCGQETRHTFSVVLYIGTFCSTYTRALTFCVNQGHDVGPVLQDQ